MKPTTDKFTIAAALQEIGSLLELKSGEYFKARADKAGARAIAELTEDIGKLIKQNRLTFVKGIGFAIAKQIQELYATGESPLLKELRSELPPGILELANVPGLNLKKIDQLHKALGISSIPELKAACEAGNVRQVKGFGARSEQKILEALASPVNRKRRLHLHHALRISERIIEFLSTAPGFVRVEAAGALRRRQETVSEIVVVAGGQRPAALVDRFSRFPLILRVEERSSRQLVVILTEEIKAALLAVQPEDFALALWRATGSEAHLRKLDLIAAKKRLKITLRGIEGLRRKGSKTKPVRPKAEPEIYARLNLQFVPPELREDEGEVEAALKGTLPDDLIKTEDIRGMVHCHTTYSDGKHSVEEMVHAAEQMGMKYITITDHSPTAFYAGGVKIDRLQRQWEEIDRVQEQSKIKILKGTESDIIADGSLDYPDWILEQFDVIVASIHSRYKMNEDQMTRRIVTAMRQPVFKIWGHALGRLLERRPPFACRVEEILDVIAESRAAIEVNGDPYRLDMEPRWLRAARKRRIKFVISVDAHSTGALHNLKYGVAMARRGWVRRGEVLNTQGVKAFQKAVRPV
ncbi:MAG: DNA polymerase/3'-5' exonuclease PolX [Acidobacteria bacterium]|nr:MAG: DNA polymerase/3'-5' exonuclease PolX [Acidobacteriota bacterium]